MNSYVDVDFYNEYSSLIIDDDIEKLLCKGSQLIDILTDYHIQHNPNISYIDNFNNLYPRQQQIIKECICEIIDYQYQNKEIIDNKYENYSINGLSVKLNEKKLNKHSNIFIDDMTFNKLYSTGLIITTLN